MLIRGYLQHPPMWAPDPGEVIYARRGPEDKFVLAIVEKAWRNRLGQLRLRVMWLEADPDASPGERDRNDREGDRDNNTPPVSYHRKPVAPRQIGWLTIRQPIHKSPLIKRIDREDLPRQPARSYP